MTTDVSLSEWERAYASRVVDAVNALRERRGITIPQLREKLESFGWSASVETLNGIFSSKKRKAFSVGELLTLANALSVPPLYLMSGFPLLADFPPGPVLPEGDSLSAFRWLSTTADSHPLRGNLLGVVRRYTAAFAHLQWRNALWTAGGGHSVAVNTYLAAPPTPEDARESRLPSRDSFVHEALEQLGRARAIWRDEIARGVLVPDIPPVPPELRPFLADDGRVTGMPDAPIDGLSPADTLEHAHEYLRHIERVDREMQTLKEAANAKATDADQ